MPTYTILIKNHSNANQQYLLFSAPPNKDTSLGKVWSNVWVKTGGTPTPNGSQKIVITQDVFAIAGTTPSHLSQGVYVTETDWAGPAALTGGSTKGTSYKVGITNGTPEFSKPPYGTTEKANSFNIDVLGFNPQTYPNVQIGLGKYDSRGDVVPAFVFTPHPNTSYDITPVVTYYIATGSYSAGQVVDITSYGAKVEIDFTTAPPGRTQATIVHEVDGSYSGPTFDPPSGQKGP
ncbi:MAG: hypothetical protein M1829_000493 [Trizodia sp. TS-e1964]|nr:MAG: hypothetical protein M1829_000493 [Trizodia sp. TS-e1964]